MTETEQESRDKSREFREIILNKDGKRLIDWIAEKEVELTRLKGLVREMGESALDLYGTEDFEVWAQRFAGHEKCAKRIQTFWEILSRPEVRAILEDK